MKKRFDKFKQNIFFRLWRFYRIYLSPCTLEIHLADHCNINCKSCNHYSPLSGISFLDFKTFKSNISQLKGLRLNFRLLGGEPLLNPNIENFIILLREYFANSKIEILTNGILLQEKKTNCLSPTFFNTCRKNEVSILITKYPIPINYEKIIEKLTLENIRSEVFGDHINKDGFFSFKLKNKKQNKSKNFNRCNEICLQLKDNKIFGCAQAAYIDILNKKFNSNFKITKEDYLEIDKIKNLRTLIKFRSKAKPFCGYCEFPRKKIQWSISKKNLNEWIVKSE